jgi:putative SOS response-associated peptidase YedK
MCGRYSFDDIHDIFEARSIIEDIASRLGNDAAESVKTGDVCPNDAAAVLAQKGADHETGIMSWGFPKSQTKQLIINARSETIFDLNLFRRSIYDKKCLIPCTGFYEWKSIEKNKIKYIIRPEGQKFFILPAFMMIFIRQGSGKTGL